MGDMPRAVAHPPLHLAIDTVQQQRNLTSVVIPSYMEATFRLNRAVHSALLQAGEIEVLVVFDQVEASDFAYANHPSVRVLATGRIGAGPSVARNLGMAAARGDCVAFLDSDDHFLSGKIEELRPRAMRHGAAFDNPMVCREDEAGLQLSLARQYLDTSLSRPRDLRFFASIHRPLFGVFRRDAIADVRFAEDYRFAEDAIFNLEVIRRLGGAFFHARPLHRYVVRRQSLSHAERIQQRVDAIYGDICRDLHSGKLSGGRELEDIFRVKRAVNGQYIEALRAEPDLDFHAFMERSERSRALKVHAVRLGRVPPTEPKIQMSSR